MNRLLLAGQLVGTLALLAFVPGAVWKVASLLLLWWLTFRPVSRRELLAFLGVSALFSLMDLGALRQGVFFFKRPDFLGLPLWEFLMWGFYVLHLIRMIGGPPPLPRTKLALALAVVFSVPFSTIPDAQLLFWSTLALLAVSLYFFHERLDLAYTGYMILVGALVEYTGVHSGQWAYPGAPPGGVPFWFITMWGGVGLFSRQLLVPLLRAPPRGAA